MTFAILLFLSGCGGVQPLSDNDSRRPERVAAATGSERSKYAVVDGERFPPADIAKEVKWRAELAGEYLARMVTESGRFRYEYDPIRDRFVDGYNMLRHAGSAYAMADLLNTGGNNVELRKAFDRAVRYMKDRIVQKERVAVLLNDSGEAKLGGNALAILALLEFRGGNRAQAELKLAEKLGRWMIDNQARSGRFAVHKMDWKDKKISSLRSRYYPGEAVFALAKLYSLTEDETWLDASRRAAEYTGKRLLHDNKIEPAEHDHWLLYGLSCLHEHRQDTSFVLFTRRIVDAIVRTQHKPKPVVRKPPWVGGWYRPPRCTPTSTRCEGLVAAYRLFHRIGDRDYMKKTFESLFYGITFLNRNQIAFVKAAEFPNASRVLGGVPASLTDMNIRIDYAQHALSCWLGFYRIASK